MQPEPQNVRLRVGAGGGRCSDWQGGQEHPGGLGSPLTQGPETGGAEATGSELPALPELAVLPGRSRPQSPCLSLLGGWPRP